jgi:hypothetical protein
MTQLTGTLANFIERTRRYLKETTAAKSHWEDDFLKQLFNTAYRRRCTQLVMAHEGYFTTIATRDLVADQEAYAWPTDFQRLLKLELVREDGRTIPLERNERHYHVKHTPNASGEQYFPTFRPIGSGYVLEPAPNETVTGGQRLEYIVVVEELTDDGDSIHSDFPAFFDELLVLDTAVTALDQESTQEIGQSNQLLRLRIEWEQDFRRFIENRLVSVSQTTPFLTHYTEA